MPLKYVFLLVTGYGVAQDKCENLMRNCHRKWTLCSTLCSLTFTL